MTTPEHAPSEHALRMAADILWPGEAQFIPACLECQRLARYIDAHPEQFPVPVDPLLMIVKEEMAKAYRAANDHAYAGSIEAGMWDELPYIQAALAACRRVKEGG